MSVSTPTVGTQVANTTASTTLSVPYPATNVGELLILGVASKSNAVLPTVPAGFTSIARFANAGSPSTQPCMLLAYKSATGSETGNLAVTVGSAVSTGQIWSVPDVDLVRPLNVAVSTFNQTTGATSIVIPGITTISDGCLLVILASDSATGHTATPPSGFTETADLMGTQPIEFCYNIQGSAGATGDKTILWSGTAQSIGALVALNPRVEPQLNTVTATAFNATVTTSQASNPQAENVAVTVTANDAVVSTNMPNAENIPVTVAAFDATIGVVSPFTTVLGPTGTQVRPGIAMRVRVIFNGIEYDVWRGHIDSWDFGYFTLDHQTAAAEGTDVTRMLSGVDRTASTLQGAGEDTGTRLNRILDSAGFPTLDRNIADGDSNLQATDLSGNAWDEAVNAAQSEGGELFAGKAGRIVFRNRRAALTRDRSTTPVAVFGDAANELDVHNIEWSYDDQALWNSVVATNVGGTPQTVTDNASADFYGLRQFDKSGLMLQTDGEAEDYAGWLVYLSRNPEYRIDALTITPRRDPATLFPVVFTLSWGDLIQVNLTPGDGGPRVSRNLFIRGIHHTMDPDGNWESRFVTQSATAFSFWTLEDPVTGSIGKADDGTGNALSF